MVAWLGGWARALPKRVQVPIALASIFWNFDAAAHTSTLRLSLLPAAPNVLHQRLS
jgi:hypothetical protein